MKRKWVWVCDNAPRCPPTPNAQLLDSLRKKPTLYYKPSSYNSTPAHTLRITEDG